MRKFLIIFIAALAFFALTSCQKQRDIPDIPREDIPLEFTERVPLEYAESFAIDRYENGYSIIHTPEQSYIIIPENAVIPEGLDENIKIIRQPADNIYLAATADMCFFDALGETASIGFSSVKAQDWYIESAREAMEDGDILFAGKYRDPDYELLLDNGCTFSIQSTMINHTPDVKDKLEELGITVFTDYSSYETHPLGRCEWIKVYGEILGKSAEAEDIFNKQAQFLSDGYADTGKTAAFFYINPSGQAVTRKSGDYTSKMIELAGGHNAFKFKGEDNSSSSVTIDSEDFYTYAKDADYIIYNNNLSGKISSMDELIAKNNLIADFKAVKEGNVYCTLGSLFQESVNSGEVIDELNAVFTNTQSEPVFLYRLQGGENNEK